MRRAAPLLVLALLAGCSSSHANKDTATAGTTASPTTTASAGTATTPGASPTTSASVAASTPAGATTGGGGSTSAQPTTSAASRTATKGTPAGTYTYDSSGTSSINGAKQAISGTSSLDVSNVVAGSQSSTLHNSQGDTTQSLLVRDNGSFLHALTVKSPQMSTEFDFAPPALLLADPAKVGATWSWAATSTDGKTTVKATNKLARTETVTIGGQQVPTVVVQTHLVITNKDFSYTADTTNWVDAALRLPVKTHTVGSGTYGTLAKFTFDVTDVMRSIHPS